MKRLPFALLCLLLGAALADYLSTRAAHAQALPPSSSGGRVLTVDATSVGNVGTGVDTLITYHLPANSLVTTGRGLRIKAAGTVANTAATKDIKCYFGAALLGESDTGITSDGWTWILDATVIRTGASAQKYVGAWTDYNANATTDVQLGSSTEAETGAITIKCTCEATDDNDCTQELLVVDAL